VILTPDPNTLIPTTCREVVAKRSPANIPNGSFVAFVNDETSPCFEGPEADSFVGRTGEEKSRRRGRDGRVWVVGASN
jgi:hypothetical protein